MDYVKTKEENDAEFLVLDIVKEEYNVQNEDMAVSYPEKNLRREEFSESIIIKTEEAEQIIRKETYECSKCKLKFLRPLSLEMHICKLVQHVEHAFLCCKCSVTFREGTDFLQHLKTHHADTKETLRCPLCFKTYKYGGRLLHHVTKHIRGPQFKCNLCVRILCGEIDLQRHISFHPRALEKKLICRQCGKVLDDYDSYEKHSQTHRSKLIYCPRCSKTFKNKEQMEKHLASQHSDKTLASGKQVQNVLINQQNSKLQELRHSPVEDDT